ncbi:hypothetical protein CAPTEDRAFT_187358 [Capitella teleta]|uniref:G-protein coupled receptors family 1 profile domain-containing protein n=1 Tax=Capitella teleta TaxID=283909 RepID=X1ZK61_CAPTE|nr:hypothetical protein CAPTEDRAFT_187358 [Capitella teleta]|eukprot:ELU10184.1 hypothetical protein CAPTEDRAFT_187358 [Capitella teleta]
MDTTETPPFDDTTGAPLTSIPVWNTWLVVVIMPTTLGVVGNILVVASYLKFPELQCATNLLVTNQGLADLLTCAFSGWYSYMNYTFSGIHLASQHKHLCLLTLSLVMVSLWSSLFNLLFLSIDRFVNIQFPFVYARIVDETLVKKAVITLWVVMFVLLSVPLFGVNTWKPHQTCGAANVIPRAYFVNFFLVASFLVLLLVAAINLFICAIVIRKRRVSPSGNEVEQNQLKSQYKLTKMLLAVVGIFYVCWLPYAVTTVVLVTCPSACFPNGIPQWAMILLEFSKVPVAYNSALNPLIYVWKNRAFKKSLKKILNVPVSATDWGAE